MFALRIDGVEPALHINYDFVLSLIRLLLRDFRLVAARIRVNQLITANMISFAFFFSCPHRQRWCGSCVFCVLFSVEPNRVELSWKPISVRFISVHMRKWSQTACAIFSHLQLDSCRPIRKRYKNHAPSEKKGNLSANLYYTQWPSRIMAMAGGRRPANRIKTEYLIWPGKKMPLGKQLL